MPSRFKNIEQKADDKNNDDNNDNEDASTPKVVPGHHLYFYFVKINFLLIFYNWNRKFFFSCKNGYECYWYLNMTISSVYH